MKENNDFREEKLVSVIRSGEWRFMKRGAAALMEAFRAQRNVKYYRASLRAEGRIFSYEGDKTALLEMLEKEANALSYEVLAFTLLDNELVLLLCKEDGVIRERGDLLKALQSQYDRYFQQTERAVPGKVKERIGWKQVAKKDVAGQCIEIHRMAVEKGYASSPEDFWWSSANHFNGRYAWRFLNIWRVMANISAVPSEALDTFRANQEKKGIPKSL